MKISYYHFFALHKVYSLMISHFVSNPRSSLGHYYGKSYKASYMESSSFDKYRNAVIQVLLPLNYRPTKMIFNHCIILTY